MSKVNRPGSRRPEQNNSKNSMNQTPTASKTPANPSVTSTSGTNKGKQGGKNRKPEIGGSAVVGAKSTQPKEITSTNPQQQQAESYNRQMRRRMEHMGTGPYTESPTLSARDKKKKRLEKKKQERLQDVNKVVARGPNPNRVSNLGRRNTYFILGVIAVLVLLIVIFLIIRHPF
jgi:cobalamin biosynthesis Mg chelatase CobN